MVQSIIRMPDRTLQGRAKSTGIVKWRVLEVPVVILVLVICATRAWADAALLMEEPYGEFGSYNPTGHSAIYLNHVCAGSPVKLRACHPDEYGVVISRYYRIGRFDWIAIPLVPYLYAVDEVRDIPLTADAELESRLRDEYRRQHLLQIAPNVSEKWGDIPNGNWTQLVGASYDRKIYGFQIETTPQQDRRLIAMFNKRRNVSHFNLFFHNCADFSRDLLNDYYPHAVHRNFVVDFALTTPKQDARSLTKYAKRHPELTFSTFVVPQVPGRIPRSKPIHGVLESLVKSKKYAAPLLLLSPELVAGMVAVYLVDGRFRPPVQDPEVTVPLLTETNAVTEPATRRVLRTPSEPNATAVPDDHICHMQESCVETSPGSVGISTDSPVLFPQTRISTE